MLHGHNCTAAYRDDVIKYLLSVDVKDIENKLKRLILFFLQTENN